ncbi:MAG: hypothetical protein U5L45_21220 [Saprospiraceae bacterium]|nr:hypothetical protein [Saprospiraceae bacterium]
MVHFFGQSPKNEPHSPPLASEASARTSSLDFMYGFKESIINEATGLISENFLDEISEELGEEFDSMFEVYKNHSKKRIR